MDTERNSECRAPKRPVRGRRMFTAQHNISAWTEKGVQLRHGARRQQLSCKGCFSFSPLSGIFPHAGRCNRWRQLLCKLNMTNHFCETLGGATDNSGPPTVHAALRLDGVDPNTPIINCCSLSSQLELAKNIHAGWDFFISSFSLFLLSFFGGVWRVFVTDSVTSLLMSACMEEWSGLEESLFLSVALSFSTWHTTRDIQIVFDFRILLIIEEMMSRLKGSLHRFLRHLQESGQQ